MKTQNENNAEIDFPLFRAICQNPVKAMERRIGCNPVKTIVL